MKFKQMSSILDTGEEKWKFNIVRLSKAGMFESPVINPSGVVVQAKQHFEVTDAMYAIIQWTADIVVFGEVQKQCMQ